MPDFEEFFYSIDESWGYDNTAKEKTPCLEFPDGLLFESTRWRHKLKRWIGRIQGAQERLKNALEDGSLRTILHH